MATRLKNPAVNGERLGEVSLDSILERSRSSPVFLKTGV